MIMEAFEGFKKAKYLTMMSIKIGTCELLWMLRLHVSSKPSTETTMP